MDDVHFDTVQVIDNGDQVIALGSLHGHLDVSGMRRARRTVRSGTFRDAQVVRMQWFNTHRETLEAAGSTE